MTNNRGLVTWLPMDPQTPIVVHKPGPSCFSVTHFLVLLLNNFVFSPPAFRQFGYVSLYGPHDFHGTGVVSWLQTNPVCPYSPPFGSAVI